MENERRTRKNKNEEDKYYNTMIEVIFHLMGRVLF